ncbi:MAG: glutathione S-transferase N-terminal domain-containing protein [Gammaproteobacteria bacterium]|nr:glutathione S-transferase N-terminal domain-containing protein [Gammaproteobacteria bacterium]
MKLYGSLTSPYVRKIRVLIKEKNSACEFSLADAWAPDSSIPALNPLGKVPVLVLDNGEVFFDSPLIAEYLDSLSGEALIPKSGEAHWQVLRWHALAQGMLDATVTRLLETRRPADKQSPETIARQESKIAAALQYAEARIKNDSYLVANRLSLADIALGVALEYIDFRYAHDWRRQHPRLTTWLAGIGDRPAFIDTRPPGMEKR